MALVYCMFFAKGGKLKEVIRKLGECLVQGRHCLRRLA